MKYNTIQYIMKLKQEKLLLKITAKTEVIT